MGNVTVSTPKTHIYYPSDWLIDGGPPMDVMGCVEANEQDDAEPLQVIYNPETQYFGVTHNGYIVMESKDSKEVGRYIQEYVYEFQHWVENNND